LLNYPSGEISVQTVLKGMLDLPEHFAELIVNGRGGRGGKKAALYS